MHADMNRFLDTEEMSLFHRSGIRIPFMYIHYKIDFGIQARFLGIAEILFTPTLIQEGLV